MLRQRLELHFRWPRCKNMQSDMEKPNFIISSDIKDKVDGIVRKFVEVGREEGVNSIEITRHYPNLEFNLNVELNALVSRNSGMCTSELMRDNVVFLAKRRGGKDSSCGCNALYPMIGESRSLLMPYKFDADEVFIVSVKLRVLDFRVVASDQQLHVSVGFLQDESYGLLLLSDEQFIHQIEEFIRSVFMRKFKKLQESLELREKTTQNGSSEVNMSMDTTFDSKLGYGGPQDRSFVFEDDYDSSLEELLLLKSNETKSSNNEDTQEDEVDTSFGRDSGGIDHVLFGKLDLLLLDSQKLLNRQASLDTSNKQQENFIGNLNNLRHNDEYIHIDNLQEVPCSLDEVPESDRWYSEARSLRLQDPQPSPRKYNPDLIIASPPKSRHLSTSMSVTNTSPAKNFSLSRKTSAYSMITYEDTNPELEYAFQNKSNQVPQYLKKDKKFKFIKVGKVQKFVNLFEENKLDEPKSKPSSRPVSPFRSPSRPNSRACI